MVARFRTNVLKREEKGVGPISFPRLLLSGLSGVFAMLGLGKLLGFGAGCVSSALIVGIVLFVTQPVSGTPMGQYLTKIFQGTIIVRARKAEADEKPSPVIDMLVNALSLNPEDGILNCDQVFDVPDEQDESHEVTEMVFFRDITDLDQKGLQVIENPFNA